MCEIVCTGLKARTPIGFLAALGTFRHSVLMKAELGDVRLGWTKRGSEWCATLTTQKEVQPAELIQLLVNHVATLGPRMEFSWAEQIKKNTVERFRDAVQANPPLVDWFSAFGTELALSKDGTLRSTLLDMTGGQQSFLLKLLEGSAALAASPKNAEALLTEALLGPWLYQPSKKAIEIKNSHSLGLDPSTQLAGAFTGEKPADINDKRGIRGAIWLAFESLPLFPCALAEGRLRTTGFFNERGSTGWKTYFEWGVWQEPLSLSACKILLAQSREQWTRSRGIRERFRSERINLNKDYYALGPAELVVQ
jgi:hypothetical protein